MNKSVILDENGEELGENVLKFKLKTDDETPDENWLAQLVVGTCFLSRERNDKGTELIEQHVVHQGERSTYLLVRLVDGRTAHRHVDTLRYSRNHICVEVLGVTLPEPEKQEEENSHGDGN